MLLPFRASFDLQLSPQGGLRCNARRAPDEQEAKRLGHNYIGTEMVLMGLLLETEGMAAQVLRDLAGLQADATRQKLELLIGRGDGRVLEAVDIPFTHHTSQLLQQAMVEAQELGASHSPSSFPFGPLLPDRKLAVHLLLMLIDVALSWASIKDIPQCNGLRICTT